MSGSRSCGNKCIGFWSYRNEVARDIDGPSARDLSRFVESYNRCPMVAEPIDRPESHVDRVIREAMEAGEFDDLPGTGKPIPGAGTVDDDLWWVRSWIRRNTDGRDPDHPASISE